MDVGSVDATLHLGFQRSVARQPPPTPPFLPPFGTRGPLRPGRRDEPP